MFQYQILSSLHWYKFITDIHQEALLMDSETSAIHVESLGGGVQRYKVTFSISWHDKNGEDVSKGQIPSLFFETLKTTTLQQCCPVVSAVL